MLKKWKILLSWSIAVVLFVGIALLKLFDSFLLLPSLFTIVLERNAVRLRLPLTLMTLRRCCLSKSSKSYVIWRFGSILSRRRTKVRLGYVNFVRIWLIQMNLKENNKLLARFVEDLGVCFASRSILAIRVPNGKIGTKSMLSNWRVWILKNVRSARTGFKKIRDATIWLVSNARPIFVGNVLNHLRQLMRVMII